MRTFTLKSMSFFKEHAHRAISALLHEKAHTIFKIRTYISAILSSQNFNTNIDKAHREAEHKCICRQRGCYETEWKYKK